MSNTAPALVHAAVAIDPLSLSRTLGMEQNGFGMYSARVWLVIFLSLQRPPSIMDRVPRSSASNVRIADVVQQYAHDATESASAMPTMASRPSRWQKIGASKSWVMLDFADEKTSKVLDFQLQELKAYIRPAFSFDQVSSLNALCIRLPFDLIELPKWMNQLKGVSHIELIDFGGKSVDLHRLPNLKTLILTSRNAFDLEKLELNDTVQWRINNPHRQGVGRLVIHTGDGRRITTVTPGIVHHSSKGDRHATVDPGRCAGFECEEISAFWATKQFHRPGGTLSEEEDQPEFSSSEIGRSEKHGPSYFGITTEEDILRLQPSELLDFKTVILKACKNFLVDDANFGAFLKDQFDTLPESSLKVFAAISINHSMVLTLETISRNERRDPASCQRLYVLRFYEPRHYKMHMRLIATSLNDIDDWRIMPLFAEPDPDGFFPNFYHPEPSENNHVLMFREWDLTSIERGEDCQLLFYIDEGQILASVTFQHLMQSGLADEISKFAEHLLTDWKFGEGADDRLIQLLTPRNEYGYAILFAMVVAQHSRAISAYISLLFKLKRQMHLTAAQVFCIMHADVDIGAGLMRGIWHANDVTTLGRVFECLYDLVLQDAMDYREGRIGEDYIFGQELFYRFFLAREGDPVNGKPIYADLALKNNRTEKENRIAIAFLSLMNSKKLKSLYGAGQGSSLADAESIVEFAANLTESMEWSGSSSDSGSWDDQ